MTDAPTDEFDDFEDEGPDDAEAIDAYGKELIEAVTAFGGTVELPFDGMEGGA